MRCASALSTERDSEAAIASVLERVGEAIGGGGADLALAFVSPDHAEALGPLAAAVRGRRLARHILGCTGESIVGEDREIEGGPAIALWAVAHPGLRPRPIRLTFDGSDFQGWPGPGDGDPRALILLGDPFTFPADHLLRHLAETAPGLPVVGGMASGGQSPGVNHLTLDGEVVDDGAVAVLIEGPVTIRTVVSQGCRPIGRPMVVTRVERNLIRELGRRPAMDVLREQFAALEPEEQELVGQGLHLGRVINEYQETFHTGDFLVRNVLGADDSGAIAITDSVRVGQTVQFHVRDARTADDELRNLLARSPAPVAPAGGLLFTCNGRGTRMFPGPDHDVRTLHEAFGSIPVAGFFAMGEIGPVGGQNFLHGFTASIALFGPVAES
jgi:small ligand-binding sensory domain FIST